MLPELEDLTSFKDASAHRAGQGGARGAALRAARADSARATTDFGAIRIGVSTLLVRGEIIEALRAFGYTAAIALAISTMVAMLLAQWMLRPIHVIQSGLSRLGRGELDVTLDLPGQEFADLGQLVRGGQRAAGGRAVRRRCRDRPRPSSSR